MWPSSVVWFLVVVSANSVLAGSRRVRGGRVSVEAVTSPVTHAEGPHWDHELGVLYFVDISECEVLKYNASNNQLVHISVPPGDQPISLVIPVNGTDEETLLVTRGLEVVVLDVTSGNVTRQLANVDEDKPGNRFNDGKADSRGRLWAGTMGPEEAGVGVVPDQGSLYLMDSSDLEMTSMVTDIDVSNGLAWNSDNTQMYYIDTGTDRIDVFDYDIDNGNISNRRVAFDFTAHNVSGSPDSMTIDTNGTLWVACWGGYQVVMIDPVKGELIGSVNIPAQYVTSVSFGGPDLSDLYVTTSRRDLSEEEGLQQPLAGAVFKVTGLGVKGYPANSVNLPPQN